MSVCMCLALLDCVLYFSGVASSLDPVERVEEGGGMGVRNVFASYTYARVGFPACTWWLTTIS